MAEGTALVNLGELAKPATVLIEKISEAVGGVFKPHQIKRIAKAEAEAALIEAKSEIKITDLHRRAMHRFINEEAKKQENIEAITAKAIPQLEDKSQPQKMDDDWIANFFDKSRIVSDSEMQELWAKVLAGEANAPGTYSKRTVNFIGSLDKSDAILFTKLCGFACMMGGVTPLIFDVEKKIYADADITFAALTHLDNIGLLRFESVAGFARQGIPKRFGVYYYGTFVGLEFPKETDNQLEVGKALLSQAGLQLAPICGSKANPAFLEYVLNRWQDQGLAPFSPYPRQPAGA